ncbi:hypothetical protein L218DRAFT_961938 [Marasmius fiardii PR-910]|nr:hypothetical protein L218DRAFT_961938 [Marasmius fiardii PR-910]
MNFPPLVGDGKGTYRVHVVGNSGSGKTTVSAKISSILNLPHFSLDRYFWEPGWKMTPPDEFQGKIEKIMRENSEGGWVIDGEYRLHGGRIVSENATDIIFLRTFLRLFRLQETCSPACKESWIETFFSKNSILLYCLSAHSRKRKVWREEMQVMGIGVPSVDPEQQKLRRIGGWGGELKCWLEQVEELRRGRK